MIDLGMNDRACALADRSVDRAAELRIAAHTLENGARVIDAGVKAAGGFETGLAVARMCMGGIGHVRFASVTIDVDTWPGVRVWTDHPSVSCMASQYAGWAINPEGFFAMGSGPLRAIARVEKELFGKLGYAESAARGLLVLEGRVLPTPAVVEWIAVRANIAPDALTVVIAPTASIAGGVQIVSRVIEAGLHKMHTIGFDVNRVSSAMGTAPLATLAHDDMTAIGRTNDCILYGGQAQYVVQAADDELSDLAERLPATASRDYGEPFSVIFSRYGNDFYKIDPMLFSPAEVWLTSALTGRTFRGGRLASRTLRASLLGARS